MDNKNNYDWSGWFRTMSERMIWCTSEEQMYKQLQKFKEEFNTEYGRLSRAKRNKTGYSYNEGE